MSRFLDSRSKVVEIQGPPRVFPSLYLYPVDIDRSGYRRRLLYCSLIFPPSLLLSDNKTWKRLDMHHWLAHRFLLYFCFLGFTPSPHSGELTIDGCAALFSFLFLSFSLLPPFPFLDSPLSPYLRHTSERGKTQIEYLLSLA